VSTGGAAPGRTGAAGLGGDLGLWEAVDAYQRAVDAASVAALTGGGDAGFHLRLAALEAVIERRMAVYAVVSIHRALLAGASMTQIAQATGLSQDQVAARWAAWAEGQVRLGEHTGLGMTRQEYHRAAAITGVALPGGAVAAGLPAVPDMRM
jgi:hypothetical protein